MTHRQAIIRTLTEHGKPLHYRAIAQKAKCGGYLRSSSGNPESVVYQVLLGGMRSPGGDFFRADRGVYGLRSWMRRKLVRLIRTRVRQQGFILDRAGIVVQSDGVSKDSIRQFHRYARQVKFMENENFLKANADKLIGYFAEPSEVSVPDFCPRLVEVKPDTFQVDLFRFATLLWTAPVSHGFGRRVRFLVFDDYNDKLVGLFALGDPVFNLRTRDQWIGWDHRQRQDRLYHVMDIFILGAVPPYTELLCGKLVALIAASNEVREVIRRRYENIPTVIQQTIKDSRLVLLTTNSALGRSSLYNRIRMDGRLIYEKLGLSGGWGHFHLSNGTFAAMKAYLENISHPIVSAHQYGNGPNWKIRLARTCLQELGISQSLLRHGIKRELYVVRLAKNVREVLLGQSREPEFYDMPIERIRQHFKERWMIARAVRKPLSHTSSRISVLSAIYSARTPVTLEPSLHPATK